MLHVGNSLSDRENASFETSQTRGKRQMERKLSAQGSIKLESDCPEGYPRAVPDSACEVPLMDRPMPASLVKMLDAPGIPGWTGPSCIP